LAARTHLVVFNLLPMSSVILKRIDFSTVGGLLQVRPDIILEPPDKMIEFPSY
jgi:hypothetical protein